MSAGGSWKDLFLAAEEGEITKARYHLELGVDPNFQHPEYFTAPLFEAIKHGHLDLVKILIEEGKADPALVEELTDDSAVDVALACREFAILDYLNTQLPPGERWSPHHVLVTTTGTGRNLEIGKEICRRLLGKGHRVLLVCNSIDGNHDESVVDSIQKELRSDTKNPHADCIVGRLETVKGAMALVAKIRKRLPLLNTLIHNAVLWATESNRNEDGLERSFMVNCMARQILTNGLMPLLKQTDHSRILYFLPDNNRTAIFDTPNLNATPFGKDFHWYRTFSRTAGCSTLSFLTAVREARDTSVAVSLVQAGRISDALPTTRWATSSMWRAYLLSWIFYLLDLVLWIDDNPVKLVTAAEPFLLAETGESDSLNGRIFHAQSGLTTETIDANTRSVLLSRATLEEWEQWMADFLSRSSKS